MSFVISGSAIFVRKDRFSIVDYIANPTKTYARFIFLAPPLSYVSNVYTRPFDTYVWYSAFALSALVSLVLYVIVKWEWKNDFIKTKMEKRPDIAPLRANYFDVVLMEVGAICQQGAESEPASSAGRTATIFFFITFIFIYTSYSAYIVVLLQATTDSINTIDDLMNYRIELGAENTSHSRYYFLVNFNQIVY